MEPTLQNPNHRSPLAIFIIVVLIVVAVLLAVWLRQMGFIDLRGKMVPSDITEEEKRAALSMLDPASGTTTPTKLTDKQKQAALDDIPPPKGPSNLSEAEKQTLLNQLDPQ